MERMSLWLFVAVWIHVDASGLVRDQEMWEHWTTGQTSSRSTEIDMLGANMTNSTRRVDNETMLEAAPSDLRHMIYSAGLTNEQRKKHWPIFLQSNFPTPIDHKVEEDLVLAKKELSNKQHLDEAPTDDEALSDVKIKLKKIETALFQIALDVPRSFCANQDQQDQLQLLLEHYAASNPDIGYCQGMNLIAVRLVQRLGYEPKEGNTKALSMLRFLVEKWNPYGTYFDHEMMGVKVDTRAAMKWMFEAELLKGDYNPDYQIPLPRELIRDPDPDPAMEIQMPLSALLVPMIVEFGMHNDPQKGVMFGHEQMADRLFDIVFFEGQRAVTVFSYLYTFDESVPRNVKNNNFDPVADAIRQKLYVGEWNPAPKITIEKMESYRKEASEELHKEAVEKMAAEVRRSNSGRIGRRGRIEKKRRGTLFKRAAKLFGPVGRRFGRT